MDGTVGSVPLFHCCFLSSFWFVSSLLVTDPAVAGFVCRAEKMREVSVRSGEELRKETICEGEPPVGS